MLTPYFTIGKRLRFLRVKNPTPFFESTSWQRRFVPCLRQRKFAIRGAQPLVVHFVDFAAFLAFVLKIRVSLPSKSAWYQSLRKYVRYTAYAAYLVSFSWKNDCTSVT